MRFYTMSDLQLISATCTVCNANTTRYVKGEYFLCESCYQIVKGLYTKADIEHAILASIEARTLEANQPVK